MYLHNRSFVQARPLVGAAALLPFDSLTGSSTPRLPCSLQLLLVDRATWLSIPGSGTSTTCSRTGRLSRVCVLSVQEIRDGTAGAFRPAAKTHELSEAKRISTQRQEG